MCQGIQFLLIHVLIFVSWKKGPECWLTIAPKFYYGLAVVCYVVIPAGLSLFTHNRWKQLHKDPFQMLVLFGFTVQLSHFIHFYLTIYKVVLPEARKYIAKRERKQILDEQLGSASQRQGSEDAQYIELKELSAKVRRENHRFASDLDASQTRLSD